MRRFLALSWVLLASCAAGEHRDEGDVDDLRTRPDAAKEGDARAVARDAALPAQTADAAAPSSRPDGARPPHDGPLKDAAPAQDEAPPCRAFVPPSSCESAGDLPKQLECTGLYADLRQRELACGVRPYTPAYALWSDGLDKRRWVRLPPGKVIDASDPDEWLFPVGTQFWKEFSRVASAGREPLETRLLQKTAQGWSYTTYVWSADGLSAQRTDDGVQNLMGSGHTVPSREQCRECHGGKRDLVLGWDAFLLGRGAQGVTRALLVDEGIMSDPRDATESSVPGDEVERAALGYLHVNCGVSCHNQRRYERGEGSPLLLRLNVSDAATVHTTSAVRTGVNRRPTPAALIFMSSVPAPPGSYYDLRPLDPTRSLLLARMNVRGLLRQMPRLGTHVVDAEGVATVGRWIEHMTLQRGYAAAAP